jgi:hypothetical protein
MTMNINKPTFYCCLRPTIAPVATRDAISTIFSTRGVLVSYLRKQPAFKQKSISSDKESNIK